MPCNEQKETKTHYANIPKQNFGAQEKKSKTEVVPRLSLFITSLCAFIFSNIHFEIFIPKCYEHLFLCIAIVRINQYK